MQKKHKIILGFLIGFILPLFPICFLIFYITCIEQYKLDGPTSPCGFTVIVDCEDAGWTPGEFYADIEILDRNRDTVFHWEDDEGRGDPTLLREFVKNMKWIDDNTFVFYDEDKKNVVVKDTGNGHWYISKDSKYYE